jgi:hypothetical protein
MAAAAAFDELTLKLLNAVRNGRGGVRAFDLPDGSQSC